VYKCTIIDGRLYFSTVGVFASSTVSRSFCWQFFSISLCLRSFISFTVSKASPYTMSYPFQQQAQFYTQCRLSIALLLFLEFELNSCWTRQCQPGQSSVGISNPVHQKVTSRVQTSASRLVICLIYFQLFNRED